jgi:hypothetical protein
MSPLLPYLVDPIGDTSASKPQGRGALANCRRPGSKASGAVRESLSISSCCCFGYNMQYNQSFFVGRIIMVSWDGRLLNRCEDVRYARLSRHTSWRGPKLLTRCGMGSCQGRVCEPATEFLLKWDPESMRSPIFPVGVEDLAFSASEEEPRHHA